MKNGHTEKTAVVEMTLFQARYLWQLLDEEQEALLHCDFEAGMDEVNEMLNDLMNKIKDGYLKAVDEAIVESNGKCGPDYCEIEEDESNADESKV